jgi:cell division protein FtsL
MTRRRRTSADRIEDWSKWATRSIIAALIPLLLGIAWAAYQNLEKLQTAVAVLDSKIESHSQQLTAIWQRVSRPTR